MATGYVSTSSRRASRARRLYLGLAAGGSAWVLLAGPVRADGPCVAPPGGTCTLPCDIGGSLTTADGRGGGSAGATLSGCGTGTTPCATTCSIDAPSTSGNWTAYGGARGLTLQTRRTFTGSGAK